MTNSKRKTPPQSISTCNPADLIFHQYLHRFKNEINYKAGSEMDMDSSELLDAADLILNYIKYRA